MCGQNGRWRRERRVEMTKMRRYYTLALAGLFLTTAACRPGGSGPTPGAASAERAVTDYLGAAAGKNLEAMALVWGDERGPASRRMSRGELEKRLLNQIELLCQETARPMGTSPGTNGRRLVAYDMSARSRTVRVTFTTIADRRGRWYVQDLEVLRLQELCQGR
jgi:hypothetical protein